jgi:4-hydroxybenzoate polyprenyltransferase
LVRLLALLEGTRPLNGLLVALAVALGGLLSGGLAALGSPALGWAALATALSLAAGNLWNDLADRVEDAHNAPHRPLPSGRLSPAWAWTGALLCAGLALMAAARLGPGALRLVLACLAALAWYARRGKGRPLLGNLVIAGLGAVAVLFGAAVVGDWRLALAPALLAALVHLVREAVKDLADAAGDALAGRDTWARRLGPRRLRSRLLGLLALMPPVALAAGIGGGEPAALTAARWMAAGPLFLWGVALLWRPGLVDAAACGRTARGYKGLLAAGLLLFLAAALLAEMQR